MRHRRIAVRLLCASLAGAIALGAPAAVARQAAFTIDQVMGAPYPASLAAAPSGRMVAWVFDARGARNVWVADGKAPGTARQVTSFTGDDGNDMGDLAWSPDARTLAFVRGQTIEDDAPANVANRPGGPTSREIWTVPITGGAARKVGTGHSPSFSPDGSRLIFADKHQIMVVDPASPGQAQALVTDFGMVGAMTWAPDGKRLAFVSRRRDHALIGVYDVAARTLAWMAPSFDNDATPAFSPDGDRIAFVRVPTEKTAAFVARREGLPWSIWTADAATGVGQRAWVADAGAGSIFHPTLSARNLLWGANDMLVFPWEKTGWLLPYAVNARGGGARPLARGDFETAYMTLAPDGRRLVYASNQNDIDRLHVWAVDLAGGRASPVVAGSDIEAYPQVGADGTVFALQSGARVPLHPVVLDGGRWKPLAPDAGLAAFPSAALVTPTSVSFPAKDGMTTHGQLFLPAGGGAGAHPALLFFHGGPSRQMLTGFHYMGAYSRMYALNEYFAAKGYVVLSVNYRGGIGYGLDYREAKDFGAGGGSEINDLLGAVTYLQGRSDVDRQRIGIWGGSYGGLMTALGLARASDSLAVGVDYAGVYNWASMLATLGAPVDGAETQRVAIASSPIATIDQWRSPVLVVQADDDRNVPFSQSTELVQDLRARNIPHDTMVLPNEVHDLSRYASWMTLFDATAQYLDRYLDKPTRPPARR